MSLGVKSDAISVFVDIGEKDAGLADSASLAKAYFKADRHPPVFEWEGPFLTREGFANACDIAISKFGFLCGLVFLDSHAFKGIRENEITMDRFSHDSRHETQLHSGSVVRGVFLRSPLNLASAPRHVVVGEQVGHTLRAVNLLFGKIGIEPMPTAKFGFEAKRAITVLHSQPIGNPGGPPRGRCKLSRGPCVGGKLSGYGKGALEALRVFSAVFRALGAPFHAFGAPVLDPPIRGIFAGVNGCIG